MAADKFSSGIEVDSGFVNFIAGNLLEFLAVVSTFALFHNGDFQNQDLDLSTQVSQLLA